MSETKPLGALDFYKLACEVVKDIRGNISQRKLSEDLGFSFNQVGKWESQITQIKWSDFVRLSEHFKIDIREPLQTVIGDDVLTISHKELLTKIEYAWALNLKKDKNFKKAVSTDEHEDGDFYLADFFQLIDHNPFLIIKFLSYYLDCSKVEALKSRNELLDRRLDVIAANPISCYVHSALLCDTYKDLPEHDEVILAEHAGCTVSEVRKGLDLLVQNEIAKFDGTKYIPAKPGFEFSTLVNQRLRSLYKHTHQLIADRYPLAPVVPSASVKNAAKSAVMVYPMSQEAAKKIEDLIANFCAQVTQVVKSDTGVKENVQVMAITSFPTCFNTPRDFSKK